MNKKKIAKSLEWHKKKIAELEEVLKEPERKRRFPKKYEQYYSIKFGEAKQFYNINKEQTEREYSINYVFKTKKEAEKELSRRKAETELLDMCDWKGGDISVIRYLPKRDIFEEDQWEETIYSQYRFDSPLSAQKAIDKLGKEKLKLIFRID